MEHSIKNKRIFTTSTLVKVGILSAIGYILMFISIPIPMLFPDFLKIDISDLPALLGGISLGPVAGLTVVFIKNLLQIVTGMSTTAGVGEFANFLIGGSFVLIVSFMYKNKKDFSSVVKGLILGTIVMTIVGCLANYFIILPVYELVGWPIEAVVGMGQAINPAIDGIWSFIIWMIAPFNILKAVIMSLLTIPLYKKTEKIFNR